MTKTRQDKTRQDGIHASSADSGCLQDGLSDPGSDSDEHEDAEQKAGRLAAMSGSTHAPAAQHVQRAAQHAQQASPAHAGQAMAGQIPSTAGKTGPKRRKQQAAATPLAADIAPEDSLAGAAGVADSAGAAGVAGTAGTAQAGMGKRARKSAAHTASEQPFGDADQLLRDLRHTPSHGHLFAGPQSGSAAAAAAAASGVETPPSQREKASAGHATVQWGVSPSQAQTGEPAFVPAAR